MSILQDRYRKFFVSLGIIALSVILSFLLYYHDKSGLGKGFGLAVIFVIVRYISLVAALAFILIRLFRILLRRTNFAYIFVGALNCSIGLICFVLFLLGEANVSWFHNCLVNLTIGVLIIADVFLLGNTTD